MSESVADRFRRLEPLLDRALELEGEARASFLRTCAEIHPDLIDDLRRGLVETGNSLPGLGSVAAEVTRSPATDRRGLRAGPWRLTGKIGRGGMGTVYVAQRDDGAFEKRAAVKLLRHADGRFKEQLERERQLLARLDHPGIARLLDGGLMRDGQPYLVMELAEGENLDVWCAKHKPDLQRRLAVFIDVCAAVSYAHSHLVVHRDLKPSNIRVADNGRVKLLDFGIAKILDAPPRGDTRGIAVTPEFAAPEQLDGGGITTRTDVYALGGLLYQMLTDHPPHPPFDGNWEAHIEAVCRIGPVPPSQAVRDGDGPIPAARLRGDLDAIVMRALARDPAQRYASADALEDDLRRFLVGRSVKARAAGIGYRIGRWLRRNWLAASLGGAAALALVVGSLGLFWQSQRLAEERDLARLEALRSEAVLNHLLMMFRDAGSDAGDGPAPRATDVLDQAVSQIEQEFARDPALRQGQSELACSRVAESIAELQHSSADVRGVRADLLSLQGQCLRLTGKVTDALRAYEEALDLRRAVDGDTTRRTATAQNNLALAYLQAGRNEDVLHHLEAALQTFDASGYAQSSHAANALSNLAALALSMGQLERAQTYFDRALAVRRSVSGDSAALGALLSNQGRLFTLLDRLDEAETSLSDALRLQRNFTGDDSLDTLSVRLAWGDLLLARGDVEQAANEFDAVRAGFEQRFGAEHAFSARAQIALARARAGQNRLTVADSLFEQAIGKLRAAGASGRLFLGPALCQRGELAMQQGRAAQAEALAAECLTLLAERVDESHWEVQSGRALQAAARHRQRADAGEAGRHAEAVQQLAARLGNENRLVKQARAWL